VEASHQFRAFGANRAPERGGCRFEELRSPHRDSQHAGRAYQPPHLGGHASRHGEQAVVVQARISDAVLRDPRLFSLPITPTARVPLWKGTPVTVEVAGQVPSEDLRDAAIGLIEREASQFGPEVRIESRIGVVPTMARRSA